MNLQETIKRILKEDKVCNYDVLHDIAKKMSNTLHCDKFGSCVHFAELFVEKIYEYDNELLNCFDVIEGYVITKMGDGIPQQHTWIELHNGEKIDPTFIQFKKWDDNSRYSKKIATKLSGKEYYEWGKDGTWFSERRKQFPDIIFKNTKNLQESIRRILREETEIPDYIRRRMSCFEDFINKLENGETDVPIIRWDRLNWINYQIILTAYMRVHCGEENLYYDSEIHQKILNIYEDRLYGWYINTIDK